MHGTLWRFCRFVALVVKIYRKTLPEDALIVKNTETGTIRISNHLLTIADLVQNQQHVGGLSRVATILEELAACCLWHKSYYGFTDRQVSDRFRCYEDFAAATLTI